MFGYYMNNMRVNKKTLIFIISLIILVIIIIVLKLTVGKKSTTSPQIETVTPTPTIISPTPIVCPVNENIRGKLPYVTKNYTIEYLPTPQKFFIMILGEPFERYKVEAEKWLNSYGIDTKVNCVSWAAPKIP